MDLGQPIREVLKLSIRNPGNNIPGAYYNFNHDYVVHSHYSETYNNQEFNDLINTIIKNDKDTLKILTWECIESGKHLIKVNSSEIVKKMIHNKIKQLFLENNDKFYEITDESTNDAYIMSLFIVVIDMLVSFYISSNSSSLFIGNTFTEFKRAILKTIDGFHNDNEGIIIFFKDVLYYVLHRMEVDFNNDNRI